MLLEALIAILIFSLGVLGAIGMQAVAVKQTTDARYRTEASLLVNQLIGRMWVSDRTPASLAANFNTGNTNYNTWKDEVRQTLPGIGVGTAPTVNVGTDGTVTIVIYWRLPSDRPDAPPHNYTTVTQIR
ncbi:MAG: pilV [Rhodocyclaceae bacterium]|nr:pilV [Rhodocyclaceae bacterium]